MAMNWLTRAPIPCNVLMPRQTRYQGFGSGPYGTSQRIWEVTSAYIRNIPGSLDLFLDPSGLASAATQVV